MESQLVKRVRAASIVVGECWEWLGWFSRKAPQMSVNGKKKTVRRSLWLDAGNDANNRRIVTTCGNWRCVNPDHLKRVTHAEHLKPALNSMKRRISLSKYHSEKNGKLTDAQVLEIQSSDGTQAEIAKKYGVSQTYVSSLKAGKRRAHISNPWAGLFS